MTVCGLATIDLSELTGWQQTILFIQMCLGSPVFVSWVIVLIRKYFFARKYQHVLKAAVARKDAQAPEDSAKRRNSWSNRIHTYVHSGKKLSVVAEEPLQAKKKVEREESKGFIGKLRPDMIRRMDDAPKLVNPSGTVSEGTPLAIRKIPTAHTHTDFPRQISFVTPSALESVHDHSGIAKRSRRLSDPGKSSGLPSPLKQRPGEGEALNHAGKRFRRSQTVEFSLRTPDHGLSKPVLDPVPESSSARQTLAPHASMTTFTTHPTQHTHHSPRHIQESKNRGFGGFPMPFEIISSIFAKLFPKLNQKLTRTLTTPATIPLVSNREGGVEGGKQVPYISFDAVVGRNSAFYLLTSDQMDEIGGVEYRALNSLLWIVPFYHIGIQLFCFTIIAPYISTKRWSSIFVPPEQLRPIPTTWFAAFQVVSAYTNTGTSLVDQSMVPFQRAYPMVILVSFLILAGNTSFPIFLRFLIWMLSKLVPKKTRFGETLHFLLDHPRRCFIYLFPSHQTWFLLTIVLLLTITDWFFFLILDIGNPVIEEIPLNVRVLAGLMQAIAVRAAGFAIVPLAALAPAVKVLFVIMMYISVYPIAMSVRSTNVYEEKSLGIFDAHEEESDGESEFQASGPRMTVWSRYLAMHARKQLAFDMWWLAGALFLVCIIERGNIMNPDNQSWFTIFNIIFELVSAYGTVGLSLGIPTDNFSLSGAFHPLSKLVVCLVMLRGRHRGLPVAIDRAVLLPDEFQKTDEDIADDRSQHSHTMREEGTLGSRQSRHLDEDEGLWQRAPRSNDEDDYAILPTARLAEAAAGQVPP